MLRDAYWRVVESMAATRRELAYQRWLESGYRDNSAYNDFVAAFVRANEARTQQRKVR
jgi:hypothetical protein